MNFNYINKSKSYGLYVNNSLSIRRGGFIYQIRNLSGGSLTVNEFGNNVSYPSEISRFTLSPVWEDGTLSFWVLFNINDFDKEQLLFSSGYTAAGVQSRSNRFVKLANTNEIVIISSINGTYSTGMFLLPNKLYHFVLNISPNGLYRTRTTSAGQNTTPANFMLNGEMYYVYAVENTSTNGLLERTTESTNGVFGGGSFSNFHLFDIAFTYNRLTLEQSNFLYNGGLGVDLKQYVNADPFNNGFVFDDLSMNKPLKRDNYAWNSVGAPFYDGVYLEYLNNGLSIPKDISDNYENYQSYRDGNNFRIGGNIFPVYSDIKEYFHNNTNYVLLNGMSGTFTQSSLENIIPDSIDRIEFINCQFTTDMKIGELSANYSLITFTNCVGSNLYLYGSKKNYRLNLNGCTFSSVSIDRNYNRGICSANSLMNRNDVIDPYFLNNSIDRFIFNNDFELMNSSVRFISDADSYSSTGGEVRFNSPNNKFFEIINSDKLFGGGFLYLRSDFSTGAGSIFTINPTNTNTANFGNGNQGLSCSVVNPLNLSNAHFMWGLAMTSREIKHIILPITPGASTGIRQVTLLNVNLTSDNLVNLGTHSGTLQKLEVHNFGDTRPFGENIDLSSFNNLVTLGCYFSGSLTLPPTNNIVTLHINRNMTSSREGQGATGPGLTSINRIPTSATSIRIAGHTTLSTINGTGNIDFGGRTASIVNFIVTNSLLTGFDELPPNPFQFTTIFDISNSPSFPCPNFAGIIHTMFPNTSNSIFNVSNIIHTDLGDPGLPLGTTIRSRTINISQTNPSHAMGLTALSNTIENIYLNWFNFTTTSTNNSLLWSQPGFATVSGITPSGFVLGGSDGTFSTDLVTRIRELKHVLTTQTILGSTTSTKYKWSFTP